MHRLREYLMYSSQVLETHHDHFYRIKSLQLSEVDHLSAVLNDASQATDISPFTSTHKASYITPMFASIVASQSKGIMEKVLTKIFKRDIKINA